MKDAILRDENKVLKWGVIEALNYSLSSSASITHASVHLKPSSSTGLECAILAASFLASIDELLGYCLCSQRHPPSPMLSNDRGHGNMRLILDEK